MEVFVEQALALPGSADHPYSLQFNYNIIHFVIFYS